jgi:hypothetical protein
MSATLPIMTAATPAAPTGFAVTTFSDSSISVGWTAESGHSYKVYYKLASSGTWSETGNLGSVSSYQLNSLTSNTVYHLTITATTSEGSVSEMAPPIISSTLLSAVTGLAVTEIRDVQATVTWTKKAGATSYIISHKA